jgi:hypothetical protein
LQHGETIFAGNQVESLIGPLSEQSDLLRQQSDLDRLEETQPGPDAGDPILKLKSDAQPQAFTLSLEREVRQEFCGMIKEPLHAKKIVSQGIEIAKRKLAALGIQALKQPIIFGKAVFHILEFAMMDGQQFHDR